MGTASFNWLLCCYYLCLKLHTIGRLFATPISSHCTRSRVLLPLKHERLLWPFATPTASPWLAVCNVDQGTLHPVAGTAAAQSWAITLAVCNANRFTSWSKPAHWCTPIILVRCCENTWVCMQLCSVTFHCMQSLGSPISYTLLWSIRVQALIIIIFACYEVMTSGFSSHECAGYGYCSNN